MDDIGLLLAEIDEKAGHLRQMRPLSAGELSRLREEFSVEYTYNSNAIEGNTMTLKETSLVLQGLTIAEKPLREHLEIVGHRDAFDFISELVARKERLSSWVIQQVHYLVLSHDRENRGRYRQIPVHITGALHDTAEPFEIRERLETLLECYNDEHDSPLIPRLALFHLEFERIHPFIDGNGRTGRLLVNLELMKAGYLPIDIKFTDRRTYYEAFDAYHSGSDKMAMARLFALYENERLDRYLQILSDKEMIGQSQACPHP